MKRPSDDSVRALEENVLKDARDAKNERHAAFMGSELRVLYAEHATAHGIRLKPNFGDAHVCTERRRVTPREVVPEVWVGCSMKNVPLRLHESSTGLHVCTPFCGHTDDRGPVIMQSRDWYVCQDTGALHRCGSYCSWIAADEEASCCMLTGMARDGPIINRDLFANMTGPEKRILSETKNLHMALPGLRRKRIFKAAPGHRDPVRGEILPEGDRIRLSRFLGTRIKKHARTANTMQLTDAGDTTEVEKVIDLHDNPIWLVAFMEYIQLVYHDKRLQQERLVKNKTAEAMSTISEYRRMAVRHGHPELITHGRIMALYQRILHEKPLVSVSHLDPPARVRDSVAAKFATIATHLYLRLEKAKALGVVRASGFARAFFYMSRTGYTRDGVVIVARVASLSILLPDQVGLDDKSTINNNIGLIKKGISEAVRSGVPASSLRVMGRDV